MDARMNEVYWASYAVAEGEICRYGEEALASPETVMAPDAEQWFGAGTGFRAYPQLGQAQLAARLSGMDTEILPEARDVAALAARAYTRGEYLPAEQAMPVYLRDRVAWPKPAL